ncbi:hypothetical protein Tco_1257391 [Tanacetum coccineum]
MAEQQTIKYAPQWNNMTVNNKAFTNCPSVVYQNFLKEFLSIAVTYDPFPSTDETEQCPLREFLIKFLVLNRTGQNFHQSELPGQNPSPEKLLSYGLEKSVHFCDSVSPLPLATKPKKGKSQTLTPTLPKSQGLKILGVLFKKSKRPKSKKPPTKTKVTPPKPTEGSEQSHSVSSGTVPDPQDLERNIQLATMGLPSTLDEGTHKSQPLP